MSLLKNGRSEEKEVDVVLGEVACSKIEGPPFLCKVRATNQWATSPSIASLAKPKCNFSNLNGPKKRMDVALCDVACSKNEGPHSLCKVRATSQCATSPTTGEVLSLASCYYRRHFSKMDVRKKRR